MDYQEFLVSKIPPVLNGGFEPESECPDWFKPHQIDVCQWAIRKGRAALFESFGLGKTVQQLQLAKWVVEKTGGKFLIVAPLGVRQEFTRNDGPRMGMNVVYCRTDAEVEAADTPFIITNYERVRDGGIDVSQFAGASLDESSVLRSYGSCTSQTFKEVFKAVLYRFVATATPSPNEFLELINYAHFLGVMDRGNALTRFFQRDSKKAGNLTLYPHMEEQFWLWVASWAVFLVFPSDLGYSDDGYILPPMKVYWHEVEASVVKPGEFVDSFGQQLLFEVQGTGIKHVARNKRNSINARLQKAIGILKEITGATDERGNQSISAGVLRKEQTETAGGTAATGKAELSGKKRSVRKTLKSVAGKESGEAEGIGEETCGRKSRDHHDAVEGVVYEQQSESFCESKRGQTSPVWPDNGGIRRDGQECSGEVPDMRTDSQHAMCGSLSQDRHCSRAVVQAMQCGTGATQRQCGDHCKSVGVFEQVVIWCHLNQEQSVIEQELLKAGFSVSSIDGSMDPDDREIVLRSWLDKKTQVLLSKPEVLGSGCNLQQSSKMIFAGLDYKFNDVIQSIHRLYRFLQVNSVEVHFVYSENEFHVRSVLERKWEQHNNLTLRMREIIKEHGLSGEALKMKFEREVGVKRAEVSGQTYRAINNDCVQELMTFEDDSVDMILTSVPFSDHYEYSPNINDFGFNQGDGGFFAQFDFLSPELKRVLKPGRIACIHTKDRIEYGTMTGNSMYTVNPFSDKTVESFRKHGWLYMGRIVIDTDVVRENAQSYRLGWSENAEDSTKMGCGSNEYVLIFRKWHPSFSPNNTANGPYPVKKDKGRYSRSDWQIQACGVWRTDGNELVSPAHIGSLSHSEILYWWKGFCEKHGYSYEKHLEFCKTLESMGHLPSAMMLFPPHSNNPNIWTDIMRIDTLNTDLSVKSEQNHVCPLQKSVCRRLIERYTNEGDTVLDPFGGVMTVPYVSIGMGRKGVGIELNSQYWKFGVAFCERAEQKLLAPTLFDMEELLLPAEA